MMMVSYPASSPARIASTYFSGLYGGWSVMMS
jgi:hypothetical protein